MNVFECEPCLEIPNFTCEFYRSTHYYARTMLFIVIAFLPFSVNARMLEIAPPPTYVQPIDYQYHMVTLISMVVITFWISRKQYLHRDFLRDLVFRLCSSAQDLCDTIETNSRSLIVRKVACLIYSVLTVSMSMPMNVFQYGTSFYVLMYFLWTVLRIIKVYVQHEIVEIPYLTFSLYGPIFIFVRLFGALSVLFSFVLVYLIPTNFFFVTLLCVVTHYVLMLIAIITDLKRKLDLERSTVRHLNVALAAIQQHNVRRQALAQEMREDAP